MSEFLTTGYEWLLGAVPAALAVCDANTMEVVASNALFDDTFGERGGAVLAENLGAALKAETVVDAGGDRLMTMRAGDCVMDGRDVVLFVLMHIPDTSAHKREHGSGVIGFAAARDVLDERLIEEGGVTTVCSVRLDVDGMDAPEYAQRLTTILKSCMRQSDILAHRADGEYMMIFPNCRAIIVESILENVEEKIAALNKAEARKHGVRIRFAILEAAHGKYTGGEALMNAAVAARDQA